MYGVLLTLHQIGNVSICYDIETQHSHFVLLNIFLSRLQEAPPQSIQRSQQWFFLFLGLDHINFRLFVAILNLQYMYNI